MQVSQKQSCRANVVGHPKVVIQPDDCRLAFGHREAYTSFRYSWKPGWRGQCPLRNCTGCIDDRAHAVGISSSEPLSKLSPCPSVIPWMEGLPDLPHLSAATAIASADLRWASMERVSNSAQNHTSSKVCGIGLHRLQQLVSQNSVVVMFGPQPRIILKSDDAVSGDFTDSIQDVVKSIPKMRMAINLVFI